MNLDTLPHTLLKAKQHIINLYPASMLNLFCHFLFQPKQHCNVFVLKLQPPKISSESSQ